MDINKNSKVKNRKMPVSITINVTKKFEAVLNEYVEYISKEKIVDKESVIVGVMENFLKDFMWQKENSKYSAVELLSLPDIPNDRESSHLLA